MGLSTQTVALYPGVSSNHTPPLTLPFACSGCPLSPLLRLSNEGSDAAAAPVIPDLGMYTWAYETTSTGSSSQDPTPQQMLPGPLVVGPLMPTPGSHHRSMTPWYNLCFCMYVDTQINAFAKPLNLAWTDTCYTR